MSESQGLSSVSEALEAIGRHARRLDVVRLALLDACGLTLADAVSTDIDSPPFDKAMMDGFAVRASDCQGESTRLQIIGEIAAGQTPGASVGPGQAIRINTGAPMPPGADAVIPIELIQISSDGREIRTTARPAAGASVGRRAADAAAGQMVLSAGTRLGAAQIGAAAAAGAAHVRVYRRPRLAVLVTGDELVDVSSQPGAGQIRNSNGPCLMALARQAGCDVIDLGVARDEPELLREKLAGGLASDVLCVSGGVSMGQHDHVPDMLRELGFRVEVQKIAMKPGKPSLFGVGPGGTLAFGLPGNPASAYVCFVVFVRAALRAMQGGQASWPAMFGGILESALRPVGARAEWIPALASPGGGAEWRVQPASWTGSGDVFGLARGNALIYRDAGSPALVAGDHVVFTLPDA